MIAPCAGPVFEELHAILRVRVHFFRGETALQLLELSSTMVKSNYFVLAQAEKVHAVSQRRMAIFSTKHIPVAKATKPEGGLVICAVC